MRIEISADAEQDLIDGFWFYEGQSVGLGSYFRSCLSLILTLWSTSPGCMKSRTAITEPSLNDSPSASSIPPRIRLLPS